MDRYPNMTVEELFYLIACRIEGEKFVVSCYRWSVPMLQETYDNRDNLERLQYLVRPSFRTVYSEVLDDLRKEMRNCFVEISHKEAFDLLYKEAWHEFKERIDEILDLQDITNLILQFL